MGKITVIAIMKIAVSFPVVLSYVCRFAVLYVTFEVFIYSFVRLLWRLVLAGAHLLRPNLLLKS